MDDFRTYIGPFRIFWIVSFLSSLLFVPVRDPWASGSSDRLMININTPPAKGRPTWKVRKLTRIRVGQILVRVLSHINYWNWYCYCIAETLQTLFSTAVIASVGGWDCGIAAALLETLYLFQFCHTELRWWTNHIDTCTCTCMYPSCLFDILGINHHQSISHSIYYFLACAMAPSN